MFYLVDNLAFITGMPTCILQVLKTRLYMYWSNQVKWFIGSFSRLNQIPTILNSSTYLLVTEGNMGRNGTEENKWDTCPENNCFMNKSSLVCIINFYGKSLTWLQNRNKGEVLPMVSHCMGTWPVLTICSLYAELSFPQQLSRCNRRQTTWEESSAITRVQRKPMTFKLKIYKPTEMGTEPKSFARRAAKSLQGV